MKEEAKEFADLVEGRMQADAEGFCRWLLPSGKRAGHEWEIDSLDGEPGDNTKIQLDPVERALYWKDFASGAGGGPWKLVMEVRQCAWWEAVRVCADWAGLEVPEIKSHRQGKADNGKLGRILRCYSYRDAEGRVVHQTVRFEPKDFRQRRPANEGQRQGRKEAKRDRDGHWWLWTLEGIEPVLYRLPEVLAASEVWLVEGEKDADALAAVGLVATTCPMGAKKWRRSYTEALAGKDVWICPDSDEAGMAHLEEVGKALTQAGCTVTWVDWSMVGECEGKMDAARFMNYVEQ